LNLKGREAQGVVKAGAEAEAFKRDIPGAVVRFLDTGHFALETHAAEVAAAIREIQFHPSGP